MKHEPAIQAEHDGEPFAEAIKRARAGYASGYGVEHRVVGQWLRTWGKPGQVPFEEWLQAQDG